MIYFLSSWPNLDQFVDSGSIENVESIKNFGNSDLSFSQSSSSEVPKQLEDDRMEVTSLPEIIHVHEQGQNSPKIPTMIDYKIEEAGNRHCMKCNSVISANDDCCDNCSTINITTFNNERSSSDNTEKLPYEKRQMKKQFQITITNNIGNYPYPRIRVEDEEGISIHSFSGSYKDDDSSIDESDKLDLSVSPRTITPSIMNNVEQKVGYGLLRHI